MPLPIEDLRHILTDLVDVVLVFHQLVVHLLDEVCAAVAQLRQMQDSIFYQMEAVDLVLHTHIERCGDGALFLITVNTQVAVCTLVSQLMHQRGIAVEGKDDRLILGEQGVIVRIGQTVRVLHHY